MNVYLDTSGLNYFYDNYSKELIGHMKSNGVKLYISSSTIYEILLNSNKDRRQKLINWIRVNCENKLLKSTSEILIDFYNHNCPEKNRLLFWNDPFTKIDVAELLPTTQDDNKRPISIDLVELKDFSISNEELSKKIKSIIIDRTRVDYENKESDFFYLNAQNIAKKLNLPWEEKHIQYCITASFLTFFVFCVGIEKDKSKIRRFWEILNIEDAYERLEFLIDKKPMFFKRGPIAEMTYMIQAELSMKNSKSGGLLNDCFHLVYAYFSDYFITNDKHFEEFRKTIKLEAFSRITIPNELEQITNNFND